MALTNTNASRMAGSTDSAQALVVPPMPKWKVVAPTLYARFPDQFDLMDNAMDEWANKLSDNLRATITSLKGN